MLRDTTAGWIRATVGEVVKHIFGGELRYAERLNGEPLFDLAEVPANQVDELFRKGDETRQRLKQLLTTMPGYQWDVARQLTVLSYQVTATPKKIIRTRRCTRSGIGPSSRLSAG